jgi:hypothetical protein
MASMVSRYSQAGWAQEGGDPCLPASWSWVQCSSEDAPRVFSMYDDWHITPSSIFVYLNEMVCDTCEFFFLAAHCLGRTLQEVSQLNWQSYQGWLNCKDWILVQAFGIYCLIYLFLLMQKAWMKLLWIGCEGKWIGGFGGWFVEIRAAALQYPRCYSTRGYCSRGEGWKMAARVLSF